MYMKKFIMAMIAVICTICAYANTCNYGNVRVTIRDEKITIQRLSTGSIGQVNVSVNDPKATEVRVLVACNGQRRDITVKLCQGYGTFNLCDHFTNLKDGNTYTVTLINVPGMCF